MNIFKLKIFLKPLEKFDFKGIIKIGMVFVLNVKKNKKVRDMKKILILAFLLIIFTSVFSTNPERKEAEDNSEYNPMTVEFYLDGEEFVNDIPFIITYNKFKPESVEFKLEDEEYIDDIPFDTKNLVIEYYINQILKILNVESFIDLSKKIDLK